MTTEAETKVCRTCNQPRPLSDFKRGSWGVCVSCIPKKKKKAPPKPKTVLTEADLALDTAPPPAPEKKKKGKRSVRQMNLEELKKLLNQQLGMEARAAILVALAQRTDEPVTSLRALTEINELTGIQVKDGDKNMATPLFALPNGVGIKITAEPVEIKKAAKNG